MSVLLKCETCGGEVEVADGASAEHPVCAKCRTHAPADGVAQAGASAENGRDQGGSVDGLSPGQSEGEAVAGGQAESVGDQGQSLMDVLFGGETSGAAEGVPCRGCGRQIPGTVVAKSVYMGRQQLSQFPVAGYQCGQCSAHYCSDCKNVVLDFNPLHGFEHSTCPACGLAFRPSGVVLEGDPVEILMLAGLAEAKPEDPSAQPAGGAQAGEQALATPAGAVSGGAADARRAQLALGAFGMAVGGIGAILGCTALSGGASLAANLLGVLFAFCGLFLCSSAMRQESPSR